MARGRRRAALRQLQLDSDVGETSGDRLSPRITVGVSPFEQIGLAGLQFYGTYAEGYRSPSLSETLISGLHPNGVVFPFLPNPNLRPETAKTWEVGSTTRADGIIAGDDSLRLKAAYFNNDIDDYIGGTEISIFDRNPAARSSALLPHSDLLPVSELRQGQDQRLRTGRRLRCGWGFAGLTLSVIDGHTVSYDGESSDLTTIPSSQVTGQLGFRFMEDRLIVGGEVQYNGAPAGSTVAKDYTLVNLFASYQATDDLKFNFRADNLFDVTTPTR